MTISLARTGILLLITGAGIATLAGCSSYSYADAEATPFSVVETREAQMFSSSEFAYMDREGNPKPLNDCGKESFFAQRSCKSESGAVSFAYSVDDNGGIYNATVTVDGVTTKMKCSFESGKFLSTVSICLPES